MRKTAIFTLATMVMSGLLGFAQAPAGGPPPGGMRGPGMGMRGQMNPEQMVDQRLRMMTERLNLTSDQQQKIRPILKSHMEQMRTLRQNTTLTEEARHTQMQDINKQFHQALEPILTPDQKEKLKEMMQSMGQRRGPGGAGAPPTSTNPPTSPTH